MPDLSSARSTASAPTSLPSGNVSFLFTDIEGSTKRWEEHHDAMGAAVARHDALLRGEIERFGGYVFKTVGDAFCAAFASPQLAVQAAVAGQRKLAQEDFSSVEGVRVRMGIHAGTAVERDADYYGPTVNRVARLVSIGHGGQILISDVVRDALVTGMPGGAALVDLGLRRLKDLLQPERVWQVSVAGLSSDFAPLASLDARPNNLPVQLTALIGRERDLDDIKRLFDFYQLVTIFGAGGVGKTRLALQVGADLIDRYDHGVWFADLAPISDPRLASSAVARAVGVKQSGESIDASILEALKRRSLLLVLDNCEHVLDSIAPLAEAILRSCPHVRILATSRQPLGVAGEVVHRLPSLSVPDSPTPVGADKARTFGAVALFVERARASDSRFVLTDETAPIVVEICRRLDGIPLAIELAAARVKVLALPTIVKRLDERFKILTGGSRTALPRQKTLAALIDWSYGLLDVHEQRLFGRLGVFAGGFTMDAATDVCSRDGVDEDAVLDLLASLTDKSLILADTSGNGERFRMLESTRAFALEKLEAADERSSLERSHAEHFRRFAVDALARHRSLPTETWLPLEEPEVDNFRVALGWALRSNHDPLLGAEIAGALGPLWEATGLSAEGRSWLSLALEHVDAEAHTRAAARLRLTLATLGSGSRSLELALRALETFEQCDDESSVADALYTIAWEQAQRALKSEANETIDRAIAIYRRRGPRLALARGIAMKAGIANHSNEFELARSLNREAIPMLRELGCERLVGAALSNCAATELLAGNNAEARRLFADALAVFLPRKNDRDLAICYGNISINELGLGDVNSAREAGRLAVRHARAMCEPLYICNTMLCLADIGAHEGKFDDAARLFGYCRREYEALGLGHKTAVYQPAELLSEMLSKAVSPADLARLTDEGAAWTEKQAIEVAEGM